MTFWQNVYSYFFVDITLLLCPRAYVVLAILLDILITQAIKLPFKKFLISRLPAETQKKINSLFIFVAIGFGVLIVFIYSIAFGFTFSFDAGTSIGLASAVLYDAVTRIFARIKKGEALTSETLTADVSDSAATVNEELKTATATVIEALNVVNTVAKATETEVQELSTEEAKSGGKLEEAIKKVTTK
jgi:hypothetical protein